MLYLDGNIKINKLNLDGAMSLIIGMRGSVHIDKLTVKNKGVETFSLKD